MEYQLKGCELVGWFNLLDEPWISVIVDSNGKCKDVSLKDVFEKAHLYKGLAGDTKTQDFAVMRMLLAVLHTVFSRFDTKGNKYTYFKLDDRYKQISEIDEEDEEDYRDDLYSTWNGLWQEQQFPEIIVSYFEKWRDRFYLFDEEHPFFQVRKEDIKADKINKPKASSILGKNINRLISESENKTALFSPKYSNGNNKDILTASEIARWLLTFQGYTGLADKVVFKTEKYKSSKGWLFDLGAIYLEGENLFQSLMLNCVLPYKENENLLHAQCPCWEFKSYEIIKHSLRNTMPNNLAALYTAWSRGIYIDPYINLDDPFSCNIVKLPDIEHQDNFLEPMTLWRYNENGENRGKYTPRKHRAEKALWRSFGLLTLSTREKNWRKPGIMDWFAEIRPNLESNDGRITVLNPLICAVSMQDDGNARSRVPTDEIMDTLFIDDVVLTDLQKGGWIIRINETVEKTEEIVESVYKKYIEDIRQIRQISSADFVGQKVKEMYFAIDLPFRYWLAQLRSKDEKDEKILEWKQILKKKVEEQAASFLNSSGRRDYKGIVEQEKIKNIATAYNNFKDKLNKNLRR